MEETENPEKSRKLKNVRIMKMSEMLFLLQAKFGNAEALLQEASAYMASCSGSKCEYAIGDPDCERCKGAMFG